MIPVYYINLDRAAPRRAFMEEQFGRLSIPATRIAALTPEDLAPALVAQNCDRTKFPHVVPRELACTMSHRLVWQLIVDQGLPWALVLEDDAILSSLLPRLLNYPLTTLPDLDVLRIETREQEVLLDPADGRLGSEFALRRPVSHNPGCAGYLVSRAGAGKLLAAACDRPADDIVYQADRSQRDQVQIRQVVPGLAMPADATREFARHEVSESTIHSDGHSSRQSALRAHGPRGAVGRFFVRAIVQARASARIRLSLLRGGEILKVPFAR